MFAIARRNGIDIPWQGVDEIRAAYAFTNLQGFLDIYYQGMNVLQHEQDFYDLTRAYLQRAAKDKVRHCEIFFDPQAHTDRGLEFSTVINGIYRALQDGQAEFDISFRLIPCFLRHLDESEAFETLEKCMAHREKITAVGLDSSELGHPPAKFTRVFAAAKKAGFHAVAHAVKRDRQPMSPKPWKNWVLSALIMAIVALMIRPCANDWPKHRFP